MTEVQLLVTLKEPFSVSFESSSMFSVSESDALPWSSMCLHHSSLFSMQISHETGPSLVSWPRFWEPCTVLLAKRLVNGLRWLID